jgi:hypothetical protein
MDRSAVRFVRTAATLTDRHVGLEWEPAPSDHPVTWGEALAMATAGGWRLPSASELMGFLGDAPAQALWLPPAGNDLLVGRRLAVRPRGSHPGGVPRPERTLRGRPPPAGRAGATLGRPEHGSPARVTGRAESGCGSGDGCVTQPVCA